GAVAIAVGLEQLATRRQRFGRDRADRLGLGQELRGELRVADLERERAELLEHLLLRDRARRRSRPAPAELQAALVALRGADPAPHLVLRHLELAELRARRLAWVESVVEPGAVTASRAFADHVPVRTEREIVTDRPRLGLELLALELRPAGEVGGAEQAI